MLSRLVAIPLLATTGAASAAPRLVVELFTSQGCSSCPPADRLLGELARDPDILALSLPVTYWDRLGWKDTLAQAAFSRRQEAYGAERGDGEVYTPQAIVNGTAHAVGSDRGAIMAAAGGGLPVAVRIEASGGSARVTVGAKDGASGTLYLLPLLRSREVAIGRGENASHTVTYTNIVREIVPIATWSGRATSVEIPASRLVGAEGYAVLLQGGSRERPGPILGAAKGPRL